MKQYKNYFKNAKIVVRSGRLPRLTQLLFVLIFAVLGTYLVIHSFATAPSDHPLPTGLNHTVGAYAIYDPNDVNTAVNMGLSVSLSSNPGGPGSALEMKYAQSGIRYVDATVQGLIYNGYQEYCGSSNPNCVLTDNQEKTIVSSVQAELNATASDPEVVGYYVLDDSPGNIAHLLTQVHGAIQTFNNAHGFYRPALCGFAGTIDYRVDVSSPTFTSDTSAFDAAVTNFSPQACDAVLLYPYTNKEFPGYQSATDNNYDWSLTNVLAYEFSQLRQRGWNPASEPLIGVSQAYGDSPFNSVFTASSQSLATETAAFCNAGAQAILAFTWTIYPPENTSVLQNDVALRSGLQVGGQQCRQVWARTSSSTPPPPATPRPNQSKSPQVSGAQPKSIVNASTPQAQATSPLAQPHFITKNVQNRGQLGNSKLKTKYYIKDALIGLLIVLLPVIVASIIIRRSFTRRLRLIPHIVSITNSEATTSLSTKLSTIHPNIPVPGTVIRPTSEQINNSSADSD